MTSPPDKPAAAGQPYWSEIYARYRRAMWAAAIRRLGRDKSHLGHSAESVVQDVMRRLIARGTVLHVASPEAYLVAAVKNMATDILRQEARRQRDRLAGEGDTEEAWEGPSAADVAEEVTNAVIREETEKALGTIHEAPRRAFVLRVMQGRPFTEVGGAMGISDVHASRLCQQAVSELQKKLGLGPN